MSECSWSTRAVELRDPGGPTALDVEAPASWSDLAVTVVAQRWFLHEPGGRRERSVRELVERVCGAVAAWAQENGQADAGADEFEQTLAELVLEQRATFATTVWLNAGVSEKPLTAACFILSVDDSMRSLLDWNAREGLIFQQGAGCGVNLSRVRSSREPVSRGGLASGPVSFMRGADAWAATIRSGGRARRGAKMVVLDADHPDVLAFVDAKEREEERARALLRAGWNADEVERSLALQQANHAVRVTDEFMETALRGGRWQLRAVTTGEIVETVAAAELLRACARACWACGDPGLQFADTIASWHTCPESGPISASNPCGEFLHVDDSACNLASINLARFLASAERFDAGGFVADVETLIAAQDAIVDGSGYPTPEVERNAKRFRQIGLGFTGLGELLLRARLAYDSEPARAWAGAIAALMTGVAYRESVRLARRLGAFAEFKRNRDSMLAVLGGHAAAARELATGAAPPEIVDAALSAWEQALDGARAHGVRNAQVTLVAPTGTVSLALDAETMGIEPYYALALVKRFANGGQVMIESRALAGSLERLSYAPDAVSRLRACAHEHGHLAAADDLRPQHAPLFATAVGPDPISIEGHLGMVAAVQPLVSGGVSKTLNLPADASVEDVERAFVLAWRLGLKSIAVYRQGSKIVQPVSLPPVTAAT